MEYITLSNFGGSTGRILITKFAVKLKVGDYYIGVGFSGMNIFWWSETQAENYPNQENQKVIAVSLDFDERSAFPVYLKVPKIDI